MHAVNSARERWYRSTFATLAWWPVLMFLLYSVYARVQVKYFAALLTNAGIDQDRSLVNILFLYRHDLLFFGVVAPVAMLLSFTVSRLRTAMLVWMAIIVLSDLLLYANLQSWGQVGQFLSWQALVNSIYFGLSKPEFIADYIAMDGLLKLGILLVASIVVMFAMSKLRAGSRWLRVGAGLSLLVMSTTLVAAGMGWTSPMRDAPITHSFFLNAVEALLAGDEAAQAPQLADAELDARFTTLSQADVDDFRGINFGVERDGNLLLFVLETGSIEFLDIRQGLPDHPALNRLRSKLFLGLNHYSTFPASAESNLSMLTGIYPPRAIYDTCLISETAGWTVPGFIPELRARGYRTGIFAPFKSQVPADRVVFERTGFEEVFYGSEHQPEAAGGADQRALQQMVDDIEHWSASGKRFAVAYYPQYGHGPWSPELGATVRERGEKLVRDQLDWLERVLQRLDKSGQLDRTVIVLTGDHGVRTSMEDPRVRVGMIDEYSLHVPLLLYSPHADYTGVAPTTATSHVDVAAELAQLFGIPRPRSFQGLSLHHPRIALRRQFMLADWYFGANGYRDTVQAAMYSKMLDMAYARSDRSVNFGSKDVVLDRQASRQIQDIIKPMLDLQESWITQRICSVGPAAAN